METAEKRFGKYVLLSKLAAGGMAVTYKARMSGAAGVVKDVVIKKIHPHLAEQEDFVEMFVKEAKLAATLTHGNIAQVFDFGKTDGDYFLAMELVNGQALSRVLRRAADRDIPFLPIPIALQICCRMCDGLHYAHTRKDEKGQPLHLVHRDVSPENTLLSYDGELKIIDFGIAKSNTGGKQTETGMVKGKYPYFSPEQAQAVRDLDARSDVYAVGVVLFEMLCGRRPYEGEFVAVLRQLAEGKIPRPRSLNPEISPALEQTMLKALATDRDQRYQTARDFGQACAEVLHSNYPGSTSNDLQMLLGSLFSEELEAEGNPVDVTADFVTSLHKNAQPGYGAKRREALGLKPESKATPKPLNTPPPKAATPAKPRSTKPAPAANAYGGYRPKSMGELPEVKGATPSRPSKIEPLAPDTPSRRAKAVTRPPPEDPTPMPAPARVAPRAPAQPLSLDRPELKEQRQKFVVTIGGIGIGISVLLVVAYLVFGGKKKEEAAVGVTEVWITTAPVGAKVIIDGKELGPSPVKTTVAFGSHTMAITLPAYRPWTKRFTVTNYLLIPIAAKLEPVDPDSIAQPPPTAAVDAGAVATGTPTPKPLQLQPPPPDPQEELAQKYDRKWPLRQFDVGTIANGLPLNQYETANVELKANVSYQVFTEGSYSLGKGKTSSSVMYYLEGDLPEKSRVGFLTSGGKAIKGATRLHAFAIDDDLSDNSGSLRIAVRIDQYHVPQSFVFDAQKNAIVPKPEQRFQLTGLHPTSKYLLTIRDDQAMLSSKKDGRAVSMLCVAKEGTVKSGLGNHLMLELGQRHKVTNAESLTCLFPDLSLDDNGGGAEIDIVDMADMTEDELKKADEPKK